MFANNGKISAHQVRCLLFVDWIAKLLLLFPLVRGTLSGWDFVLAVALGGMWTLLYLLLITRLADDIKGGFTEFIRERLGNIPAVLSGILSLLYLLVNACFLARLTGRICSVYLLPETSETLLAALVLAAGIAAASGDAQKRARASELLFFTVAAALALMVLASFGNVRMEHFLPEAAPDVRQILLRSGAVFAGFSGVTLFLYEVPHIRCTDRALKRALILGLLATIVFLLIAFAAALGVLGERSILRLAFPILTLMNSASLPGGFLQRWDAVFLAFLLFSLLFASGTTCHYMRRVVEELMASVHAAGERGTDRRTLGGCAADRHTPDRRVPGRRAVDKRALRRWVAALYLLAFAAVFSVRDYETAAALYLRWALCGLAPLMAAVPVFLLAVERCGRKRQTA